MSRGMSRGRDVGDCESVNHRMVRIDIRIDIGVGIRIDIGIDMRIDKSYERL